MRTCSALWRLGELLHTDGPDLLPAVQALPPDGLTEVLHDVLTPTVLPALLPDPTVVRPLITARLGTFRTESAGYAIANTLGGLNTVTATDPRFAAQFGFARGVAQALLYCHELVVEDPVALAADLLVGLDSETRVQARSMFEAAVRSSLSIDPLVWAGIVTLYWRRPPADPISPAFAGHDVVEPGEAWDAFEALYVDGLPSGLQTTWAAIRAGDRAPDRAAIEVLIRDGEGAAVEQFLAVVEHLSPATVLTNVREALAASLDDIAALSGAADLYAPTAAFTRIVLAATERPDDTEGARVRELVRLEVPRLGDLLWSDLIAIRRQSEEFEQWRAALGAGLDRISAARGRDEFLNADRAMREELADARAHITAAVQQSSTLTRLHRGGTAFVLGALGGAISATGTPPATTVAAALGAGVGSAAVAAIDCHRPSGTPQHYVLFDRTQPSPR
jgi:hypothetical protein